MKNLDRETAWAIVFANIKRKKRPHDLLTVSKAFDFLVTDFGSRDPVAKIANLSTEMVRQFLNVLKLPPEIQTLVAERKIDSIDVIKELVALGEIPKQIAAAQAIVDSQSKDVRDIKRLIKGGKMSANEATNIINDAKPKELNIFVMEFDAITAKAIVKEAKVTKVEPADLVKRIVVEWINQRIQEKYEK